MPEWIYESSVMFGVFNTADGVNALLSGGDISSNAVQ